MGRGGGLMNDLPSELNGPGDLLIDLEFSLATRLECLSQLLASGVVTVAPNLSPIV